LTDKRDFTKSVRNFLAEHKWPLIGSMWIVAFALGYVGFSNYHSLIGEPRPVLDNVYLSLQLFLVKSGNIVGPIGPALQVARFLAPAVAVYTALMAVATILQEEIKMFRSRFFNNHIVICGLGRKGSLLAKGFREKGERVIVIEQDENNSLLGQCREKGSIVMIGNDRSVHTSAGARSASQASIVGVWRRRRECRSSGKNQRACFKSQGCGPILYCPHLLPAPA